jgi:hypothetical protein
VELIELQMWKAVWTVDPKAGSTLKLKERLQSGQVGLLVKCLKCKTEMASGFSSVKTMQQHFQSAATPEPEREEEAQMEEPELES